MYSRAGITLQRPGYQLNGYPENLRQQPEYLSELVRRARCLLRAKGTGFRAFKPSVQTIDRYAAEFASASQEAQRRILDELRQGLRREGVTQPTLLRTLGAIKTGVRDVFQFELHDEQLFCAWALTQRQLPEMATGEGKSVTAAVAGIVAALGGVPVHVITTNDYLVERDARSMQPLFARFGLSASYVTADQADEQRLAAYGCDVCYVSNKQLVFDYLRDRQVLGNRPSPLTTALGPIVKPGSKPALLRGLCFAIVDEADSVLVDDAATPLILSKQLEGDRDIGQSLTAISLAQRLQEGQDYSLDSRARVVAILPPGEQALADAVPGLEASWNNRRFRNELVRQALTALHLFQRDVDYLIRDGAVLLIDQSTGRVMPDRKLQYGLHQMLEVKERCELSGRSATLSSLSFQTFFKRYKHLCGMTGTALEASAELRSVYGLGVVQVPTHHRPQRLGCGTTIAASDVEHGQRLLAAIEQRHRTGQPILIGTRSLARSELLAQRLTELGLAHTVLNARQDADEAAIIARAGARGAITIATNIAGRGTDIPLAAGTAALGGLHVIVAELNDNARIDRQLVGRCARQGDPGSYEFVLSLDDPLLQRYAGRSRRVLQRVRKLTGARIWRLLCIDLLLVGLCRQVQRRHERGQRRARRQLAAIDLQMQRRLTFTGYKE